MHKMPILSSGSLQHLNGTFAAVASGHVNLCEQTLSTCLPRVYLLPRFMMWVKAEKLSPVLSEDSFANLAFTHTTSNKRTSK